jgi:hypothetical protein
MDTNNIAIATGAVWLAGIAIWFLLWFRNRNQPVPLRALILVIVATGLLCRVGYALLTPVFYAPDEQAHFNYIKFLADRHAFPIMPPKPDESNGENCQSPLYYLAMAPLYHLAQMVFSHPSSIVRCLRMFSIALWLSNVGLGVVLLNRLQIKDRFVWVFVMSVVSLLPTYTFTSAAINNDNLLLPLSTGLLCLLMWKEPAMRQSIWLGMMLGFALLAKQSAGVFAPVIVLRLVLDGCRQRQRWPLVIACMVTAIGIAAIMYAPWALRNFQIYGTFTPELLAAPHKVWPSMAYGLASAMHNLIKTFWAVSGVANDIGYPFPIVGMLLLAGFCIFFFVSLRRASRFEAALPEDKQPVLNAFLFAVVINIILTLKFGYLLGMGQGRHLFPVLYPIAILLALRFRSLPLKNLAIHTAGFWITYALMFEGFSLGKFP